MEKEKIIGDNFESKYEKVQKFHELFILLNSTKDGEQYRNAYEEAVELAESFVNIKSKSSWNPSNFETGIQERYPVVSQDFIDALKRCIENYNPPVNIPSKPLWE